MRKNSGHADQEIHAGAALGVEPAGMLRAALGERATVVVIPNAGDALPEDQAQAMSDDIAAFARML
jgi:hypothetical protein